jgi:hypothetical protein
MRMFAPRARPCINMRSAALTLGHNWGSQLHKARLITARRAADLHGLVL